ncbi:MAG: tRNA lysidine(34) synthetase TilS [Armatimonadota bacterium]
MSNAKPNSESIPWQEPNGPRKPPTSRFASRVLQTIQTYNMIQPGDKIVAAVSGGADSCALLLVLAELKEVLCASIHAAHLHHGLRGRNADEDLEFVQRLAQSLNLPFSSERVSVPAIMEADALSEETAGRKARYAFLCTLAREIGADRIATGHTSTDQAETVLMRVLRGTGLDGLGGIPPVATAPDPTGGPPIPVIRPLINVSRSETEEFCKSHGVQFRTDPSNLDTSLLRNALRLELMPLLRQKCNPHLDTALCNLAELAREDNALLEQITDEAWRSTVVRDSQECILFRYAALPESKAVLRRLMRRALLRLNPAHLPHFQDVERLVTACKASSPTRLDLQGGIRAELNRGIVLLAKKGGANPSNNKPRSEG